VRGVRCYDNIAPNAKCRTSACTRSMQVGCCNGASPSPGAGAGLRDALKSTVATAERQMANFRYN